jgi:protein-S-isoprenylcysteine O-methyltransferase Ste14
MESIRRAIAFRFVISFIVLGAMLFLPAGSLLYWEGWLYLAALFLPISYTAAYLLQHDPELLKRRGKMEEREPEQKRIIILFSVLFFTGFFLAPLDYRFGWSEVPFPVVLAADTMVFLGYCIVFLTFRENSYASRVVEVEEGQQVVTTGPYAVVRHPMYVGVLLMVLCTPLALGSWWALVPILPLPFLLVLRIRNEEEVLTQELAGYPEYRKKTRYRLIPYLW